MKVSQDIIRNVSSMDRKPYVKIKVERVQLVLEEAVLGTGCKTEFTNGATEPCIIDFTNCLLEGS